MEKFTMNPDYLNCKNKCGYYGNSEWGGYCSKCFKERKGVTDPSKGKRMSPNALEGNSTFTRFEEKRKHRAMRNIFRKQSASPKDSPRGHDTWPRRRAVSPEAANELTDVLQQAGCPPIVTKDVYIRVNAFVDRATKMAATTEVLQLAEKVQDFYKNMADYLAANPAFVDASPDFLEQLNENLERYIMKHLYKVVFPNISALNEDKDLKIQTRIRSLNWVTAVHLDCGIKESHPQVRENTDKAITDMLEMDNCSPPQDKVNCIVRCSETIFNTLKTSHVGEGGYSADDFLPALIYIVLKANPPRLHSNISYINHFCNPNKVRSGEGGYYFTNLCCAVSFIENLSGSALNLSDEEFGQYMRGDALPPGVVSGNNMWMSQCEGLKLTTQNLSALAELRERQDKLHQQVKDLLQEMQHFKEGISSDVKRALEKFPWTIKPRKIPTDLDSEDPELALLPSPLQPQVVGIGFTSVAESSNNTTFRPGLSTKESKQFESVLACLEPEVLGATELPSDSTEAVLTCVEPEVRGGEELHSESMESAPICVEPEVRGGAGMHSHSTDKKLAEQTPQDQEILEAQRNLSFVQSLLTPEFSQPISKPCSLPAVRSGHRRIPSIPCETGTVSPAHAPFSPTSYSPRDEKPPKENGTCDVDTEEMKKGESGSEEKIVKVLSTVLGTFDSF